MLDDNSLEILSTSEKQKFIKTSIFSAENKAFMKLFCIFLQDILP